MKAWLAPAPSDQPQPKFRCEATEIDLGGLWATGRQAVKGWRFHNDGPAPLRLKMRHFCDTWPVGRLALIVPPGESRQVELEVGVGGPSGRRQTFPLRVQTNDPSSLRVRLIAACTVLDAFKLDPYGGKVRALYPLYQIKVEGFDRALDQVTASVTITRGDGGPIRPQVIAVERRAWGPGDDGKYRTHVTPIDRNQIEADLREVTAGEHYELKITARAPWPTDGSQLAYLALATAVPEMPRKTIQVYLRTEPRLVSEPRYFSVPARPQRTVERRAVLHWSSHRPAARIVDVSTNVPGLTARVETDGGVQTVVLTTSSSFRWSKDPWPKVLLHTDDPEVPEFRISIHPQRQR